MNKISNSFSLANIPEAEDQNFEYKSSLCPHKELKKKLGIAASGFANTGGGTFIIGVNDEGKADGGYPSQIGNQALGDWIDQVLQLIKPAVSYEIEYINETNGKDEIKIGYQVAVIHIKTNSQAPHQAPDLKYYIRAGAHTIPATNYIIEALWAMRSQGKPILSHTVRPKPNNRDLLELVLVTVTETAALDVEINFEPNIGYQKKSKEYFPIKVPIVDKMNPYFLDVGTYSGTEEYLPENMKLIVTYSDIQGNCYSYQNKFPLHKSIPPSILGNENKLGEIQKEIKNVVVNFQQLIKLLRSRDDISKK